jgi:RNA polymerase sigma-70 factor (ECF subfamily)
MITSLFRPRAVAADERKELFEGLLKDSYRQAYSLAYRLTSNSAEAEDLVQETYVRAYRFFHRYDEGLPFTNWLYRIMCNAHIDSVRRRGRLKTTSLEQPSINGGLSTLEVPDTESAPDRTMMEQAMGEHVESSLKEMNAEFRTAVLLADVEGMAYEEIAAVMGTSVGTVRSRIHRGRKQLRRFLLRRDPKFYGGYANEL